MAKKTSEKHIAIRNQWHKLVKKKGLRSSVAIEQIAKSLYLEETTVAAIVYQKGKYKVPETPKENEQLTLFQS